MANEPSLGELTYRPDPSTAKGDRVVVQDNSEGIRNVIGAAQQKANYGWLKYQDYNERLDKAVKEKAVDFSDINPAHKDELMAMYADFNAEMAKDPTVLMNPQKNPLVYKSLNEKFAKLNSSIAQSKQEYAGILGQEDYMYKNPELATPENKKAIADGKVTPLGKLKPITLEVPYVGDFTKLFRGDKQTDGRWSGILGTTLKEEQVNTPIMVDEFDANNKPTGKQIPSGRIRSGTAYVYDKNDYIDKSVNLYRSNQPIAVGGKFSRPIQEVVGMLYKNIDPNEKKVIDDAAEEIKKAAIEKSLELELAISLEKDHKEKEKLTIDLQKAKRDANITPQELIYRKRAEQDYDKTRDERGVSIGEDKNVLSAKDKADNAFKQQEINISSGNLKARLAELYSKNEKDKADSTILQPAVFIKKHYETIRDRYIREPNWSGKVPIKQLDPNTKAALNIPPNITKGTVTYNRDGSYDLAYIGKTEDGLKDEVKYGKGKPQDVEKGFIESVVKGNTQDIVKAETAIKDFFGTINGDEIVSVINKDVKHAPKTKGAKPASTPKKSKSGIKAVTETTTIEEF